MPLHQPITSDNVFVFFSNFLFCFFLQRLSRTYGRTTLLVTSQNIFMSWSDKRTFFHVPEFTISRNSVSFFFFMWPREFGGLWTSLSFRCEVKHRLHCYLNFHISDIGCELPDIIYMSELARKTLVEMLVKRVREGFVVNKSHVISPFHGK